MAEGTPRARWQAAHEHVQKLRKEGMRSKILQASRLADLTHKHEEAVRRLDSQASSAAELARLEQQMELALRSQQVPVPEHSRARCSC